MAVVMEHTTEKGVHIRFCDDAYVKQTPEQIQRAQAEIRSTAWMIQEAKAMREQEKILRCAQDDRTAGDRKGRPYKDEERRSDEGIAPYGENGRK